MTRLTSFRIVKRMPSVEEFLQLRGDAGWPLPPEAAVSQALQKTVYAVCAENEDGKAIGRGASSAMGQSSSSLPMS